MRKLSLLCSLLLLFSCLDREVSYDANFYYKVSHIKIEGEYKVIESVDDLDGKTITSFKFDSRGLMKLVHSNDFRKATDLNQIKIFGQRSLIGESYLKKLKPNFHTSDVKHLYYVSGDKLNNHWLYIADAKNNILWASIMYAGWADGSTN